MLFTFGRVVCTLFLISFYANLAGGFHEGLGCDKLGVKFSVNQYNPSNPAPINNFAHVYTDSVVNDTTNWYRIAGSFIADSAYSYFNIGLFFDMQHIDTTKYTIYSDNSYYFIDDVCVSTDSALCYTTTSISNIQSSTFNIQLYPNPFTNEFTVSVGSVNSLHGLQFPAAITFYDIFGKQILSQPIVNRKSQIVNLQNLSKGVYFLKIIADGKQEVRKVVKM